MDISSPYIIGTLVILIISIISLSVSTYFLGKYENDKANIAYERATIFTMISVTIILSSIGILIYLLNFATYLNSNYEPLQEQSDDLVQINQFENQLSEGLTQAEQNVSQTQEQVSQELTQAGQLLDETSQAYTDKIAQAEAALAKARQEASEQVSKTQEFYQKTKETASEKIKQANEYFNTLKNKASELYNYKQQKILEAQKQAKAQELEAQAQLIKQMQAQAEAAAVAQAQELEAQAQLIKQMQPQEFQNNISQIENLDSTLIETQTENPIQPSFVDNKLEEYNLSNPVKGVSKSIDNVVSKLFQETALQANQPLVTSTGATTSSTEGRKKFLETRAKFQNNQSLKTPTPKSFGVYNKNSKNVKGQGTRNL